jgi:hypothetical protein
VQGPYRDVSTKIQGTVCGCQLGPPVGRKNAQTRATSSLPNRPLAISALVRGDDKAKALLEQGVNPIQFRDLDDSEALTKAASEHDSKL